MCKCTQNVHFKMDLCNYKIVFVQLKCWLCVSKSMSLSSEKALNIWRKGNWSWLGSCNQSMWAERSDITPPSAPLRSAPLHSRAGFKGEGDQGPRLPQSPLTDNLPLNRWLFLFIAWFLISINDNNIFITLLKVNNAFSYSYRPIAFTILPPINPIVPIRQRQAPIGYNSDLPPQRNTRVLYTLIRLSGSTSSFTFILFNDTRSLIRCYISNIVTWASY